MDADARPDPPDLTTAPYGSWATPITPASLVQEAVGLSFPQVDDRTLYWLESRPSEGGRVVLVSIDLGGGAAGSGTGPAEVLPDGISVRTQVHEYGGRCYDARAGLVVFSNWSDQRLWVLRPGGGPEPLTPEPPSPRAQRYADPVIHPQLDWVVCVRETHAGSGAVVNDVVAVPLAGGDPVVVASGHDFYSAPRLSADGTRLAWISWDQPAMPWDATELSVADVRVEPSSFAVAGPRVVAGGPAESVTQPRWSPAGVLHYVSDRTGWWNIYDETGRALAPASSEFADPDWVFGNRSYDFWPSSEDPVATWMTPGEMQIGWLAAGQDGPFRFPFTSYGAVCPVDDASLVVLAGSAAAPASLVRLHPGDGTYRVLRHSRQVIQPASGISVPEAIDFPTGDGDRAHALFYPPASEHFVGPPGERPPLVVMIHGGPTSAASAVYNPSVQFWTSRGFAVADVNYRGSSGYGREYRRKLNGAWGVADIEDCRAVVTELAERGQIDGSRAVIRGGSAGGFTTLAALAFTSAFAAGASHYGVADLELLARDTHKFEARYLDSLVGPWPEAAEVYRARSPIHHVEGIDRPLILFQGMEDAVVPPEQSQLMYDALAGRGVPVAYLAFEGEQHGFRQASTITTVIAAELAFYGRVLGFAPALEPAPVLSIANESALEPPPAG